ncbi:alanine racemase [uncultured Acetatifactor sp.]|uniref:alanine racemase n=1 Tax=uncultured Acetatifactor sp. TaxID=1671927 RepID=UPI0026087693|nr:alanine racemase [uncultured Acetatifactor sp.]
MRTKPNYGWLDRFRIIAALAVIAIHTSPLATFHEGADFFLTRVLARIAVPFFFMVTGHFVVAGFLPSGKAAPSTKSMVRFRKFLAKTSMLYLFCIILYLPVGIYAGHYEDISVGVLLRMLFFDGTFYHLWYFPACIMGVALVYLLSRFLSLGAMTAVSAVLYAIGLLGDSYYGLVEKVPALEAFYGFLFQISSYTRNGLFLAPLFLVLGAWMAGAAQGQGGRALSEKRLFLCSLFALSFALMTGEAFLLRHFQFQRHDSMYLLLVPVMLFLYRFLLCIPVKSDRAFRTASTWIYVLHPAFIVVVRGIAKPLRLTGLLVDNSLVHYLAVSFLSVAAAFAMVWLQSMLKARRQSAGETGPVARGAARGQNRKQPEASDGAWTEESAEDDWDSDWDNMGDMAEGEFDMAREDEFNYDYSQEAEEAYGEAYMEESGLSDGIPLTDGPEEDAAAHMEADGYTTEEDFPEEQSESHAGYREAADPLHRAAPASRAWIEVDTRALAHNVDTLRARLPQGCRLMPAVKAQGYGHGAVLISRELNALGVDAFCVAGIGEAIELREADIRGEILILGYTPPEDFPLLAQYQLIQTVIDYPYACLLSQAEADIHVHIGIDTGMHRLGIRCEEIDDIRAVYDLPHIVIDGLFTHLCASDSPLPEHRAFTEAQVRAFYQVVDYLKEAGCPCPSLHLLASYGLLTLLQGRSGLREEQSRRFAERRIASAELKLAADYVRPGIALYGVMSTEADTGPWKGILKPVLSLKAKVVSVRPLYAGEGAGYGIAFTAEEDMRIAAVSIGYADGLPRELSHGKGSVLIGGHRAPIIGRICMDQTIVDVSGIPRIQPGDTAVIIGTDRGEEITAGQIAEQCGTITNEILSRLGARLDRVTV